MDWREIAYRVAYVVAFITIFIFNGFYGKHYQIKPKKAVLLTIVSYAVIFAWAYVLAWVESGFKNWGHHNAVRVYVWMPVVLLLVSKLFQLKWRQVVEFIAPSTCIVYSIARLGCHIVGCCYGIPFAWGIKNQFLDYRVFPVQLCEVITSFVVAMITIKISKDRKYCQDAFPYPVMLLMYGSTRFIWEFFADNQKIFLGCSALALHAFLMVIVGFFWLSVLYEKKQKQIRKSKAPLKKKK